MYSYVPKEHSSPPIESKGHSFINTEITDTRNIKLLSKHQFETNSPGYQLGQQSRIGDAILLFNSPELADKLKGYDTRKNTNSVSQKGSHLR